VRHRGTQHLDGEEAQAQQSMRIANGPWAIANEQQAMKDA
jgi:hypothetical protein